MQIWGQEWDLQKQFWSIHIKTKQRRATMAQNQVIQSLYDAVNNRDVDRYLSLFSDDSQFRVVSTEETHRGVNEIRNMAEKWMMAFPDGKFQVKKIIGSGDDWSVELSFVGTHQGTLSSPRGDVPATGKKVNVPACDVITLKNGKIQSLNCYMDGLVLRSQIGAFQEQKAA
jgi:steroid delta-isomerase-like uncharacterized protein